ncbi:glycine betaine/L-proline ABC transporter substrate-binding protein ProX [Limoniibacter endophyticus]|uniref:Glycine betaine ABC transporter substrate-binding protein n=1 Tax=Limoniibacter endophyticus TaxID=1565040 RepID=A0A8J3DTM3_9HYPH|nr:glycine betaine/L-proline ABC transporter substrate-binding protein ProX [Limoniibacter endophyticus]GHC75430.1 glycine betaine ABC transporter substrate-binding protein [Limoniibacter endophyticus]
MKFLNTRNLFVSSAILALISPLNQSIAQDSLPGEGKSVRVVQPNDDTGWIMTAFYTQLLEELGYTVDEAITLDVPVAYQTVSQGSADLYPDGWFPLHNLYVEQEGFGGEQVGYVARQGALQGYLVDKASAEKFDIKTLDDFKRDEVKKAFDRNGDGKADLVACPPGWGCEETITYQMDAFELHDHINPIKANYSASMADAIAAYEAGEPILFYTWTPNWTVDELKPGRDVVWIQTPSVDLPEEQRDLADSATLDEIEGCVAQPCVLGWPVNDIRPVANKEFLEENPAARTLLEEASMSIEFVLKQNAEMKNGADSPEDIKKQAAEYIEENRSKVDGWLEAAKAAGQAQ